MKLLFFLVYALLSVAFLAYLAVPTLDFPEPPDEALQSTEPADMETPSRRGYFVNLTRSEVLDHYQSEFVVKLFGIEIPSYRLNHPPEDAFDLVRDQTRSTYLEEIVYPMRESLFVNGFEPKADKDMILIGEKYYDQKITIRQSSSSVFVRLSVGVAVVLMGYLVIRVTIGEISRLFGSVRSKIL